MANIILSAKSASSWSKDELRRFNIHIHKAKSAATFFRMANLPAPQISPVVLQNEMRPPGLLATEERLFFHYMRFAVEGHKSSIIQFARHLLHMFEYDEPERMIHMRLENHFGMCGTRVSGTLNICVASDFGMEDILMVGECKRTGSSHEDSEPQLIAEAIAAFHHNNRNRRFAGHPMLASQTFPAIIMVGTAPIFYLVRITACLAACVETGAFSQVETKVQRFIPQVPNEDTYFDEGLVPLENRVVVMQCLQAFKHLL